MTERRKNLYYLDELSDYKVSSEDPDVRGWDVKDKDNRVVGKVDNLLVNKDREQVVYLDVEVDETIIEANHDPYSRSSNDGVHEFINKDGEEHIIIPIGLVKVDEDRKFVYTDSIDYQTFSETKRYPKGTPVERDYEVVVLDSYDRFGDPEQTQERYRNDSSTEPDFHNRDTDRGDFETRPDDSYKKDFTDRDRDRERDVSFEDEENRLRSETSYGSGERDERMTDEDPFYKRREFDRSNWRRRS